MDVLTPLGIVLTVPIGTHAEKTRKGFIVDLWAGEAPAESRHSQSKARQESRPTFFELPSSLANRTREA